MPDAPATPTATLDPPLGGLAPTVAIEDVELLRVGQWNASTGAAPITLDDLHAVVAAHADPEVDHAAIHPGHVDPRFPLLQDGEAAVGWVERPRVVGDRLVADLANVPVKVAAMLPKAYRRRSVELIRNLRTPSGRVHPLALTGLGLLGVALPAVKGLADVVARYSTTAAPADAEVFAVLLSEGDTPDPAATPAGTPPATGHDDHDTPSTTTTREGTVPELDPRAAALLQGLSDEEVARLERLIKGEAATPPNGGATGAEGATAPVQPVGGAPAEGAPGAPSASAPAPQAEAERIAAAAGASPEVVQLLTAQGQQLAALVAERATERRDGVIRQALSAGRIPPAAEQVWRQALDTSEEATVALLAAMPEGGAVPVGEVGHAEQLSGSTLDAAFDALDAADFPKGA